MVVTDWKTVRTNALDADDRGAEMKAENRIKIGEYGVEIGDHKNGIIFVVEDEVCFF